jgi:hypothetical protein
LGPDDFTEHGMKYTAVTFEEFLRRHSGVVDIQVSKDGNCRMSPFFGTFRKQEYEGFHQ